MGMKNKKKVNQGEKVVRLFKFADLKASTEKREADDGTAKEEKVLEGHASVFNQETDIGDYFREVIKPGAFDNADLTDVPLFVNHDSSRIPIARSRRNNGNSTMTLSIDDVGLKIRATIDTEGNPEAAALYSAIQRGDITGMSFCFSVDKNEWDWTDEDHPKRTITAIKKVYEVSAVNFPAYDGTDISSRDKDALDNARKAMEFARSQDLEKSKLEKEKDVLKEKIKILGGM